MNQVQSKNELIDSSARLCIGVSATNTCVCLCMVLYTGAACHIFVLRHCLSKEQRRCDIVIRLSALQKCFCWRNIGYWNKNKYVDFVISHFLYFVPYFSEFFQIRYQKSHYQVSICVRTPSNFDKMNSFVYVYRFNAVEFYQVVRSIRSLFGLRCKLKT